jgi:hypothetical protein
MENWTINEMKRLFALTQEARAQGKGLSRAFEISARETGRKPNSVRNYYYAQLKALTLLPEYSKKLGIVPEKSPKAAFTTFKEDEVKELITQILIRQAAGESVRAITTGLSGGDRSLMLRLQNKYRSIVFNRKSYVLELMREMKERKVTFYNPYTRRTVIEGTEDKSGIEPAVENVNALLRKFFEAKDEKDKIDSLSDYMSELGRLLSNATS